MKRNYYVVVGLMVLLLMEGCAKYQTPAAGVNISELGDADISEIMKIEPAAKLPVRLSIVRVQASGYQNRTNSSYGSGRYSVVTTRDIERDTDFERVLGLAYVDGVAPLSRLLLPSKLDSIKDLRVASARLKADVMLIYSLDTTFHVEGTPLGPLSLITLGFIPNKEAFVTTTTSGVLVDVRTGFIYGVAEATERVEQRTTMWGTQDAIDEARQKAERASFVSFLGEFTSLWQGIVEQQKP